MRPRTVRPDLSAATWAVVVARTGPTAKSRLAGVLTPGERARLAQAMLADVLATCADPRAGLAGTAVVADTCEGRAVAERRGALVVPDPSAGESHHRADGCEWADGCEAPSAPADGLGTSNGLGVSNELGAAERMNRAIEAGARKAVGAGAQTVLILPGDLPLLTADEVAALVAAPGTDSCAVVVAPDRSGTGTNALLLRPPGVVRPAFGPQSAARHLAAGRGAGAADIRVLLPTVSFDVDTPDDLAALRRARPGPATAALLHSLGALIGPS